MKRSPEYRGRTGPRTPLPHKRSTKTAPARSARTNRTADGKTVAHEDEEMLNINIEKGIVHYCTEEAAFSQHIVDTCDVITRAQWAAEREEHYAKQAREFEEARARGNAKFLEDIQKPEFAYARARHFGTMAYMRCPGSPTGVTAGATADNDFAREVLAKHNRAAALSPTEGQHRSGANLNR